MPDRSAELRVGILGAATIAPAAVISPAATVPGIHISAVAARDSVRARAFAAKHAIPRVFDTYRALIEDPDIDAVYIPLPNALHGTWTRRAIQAGKHVLCEKPFAANAREAAEVSAIAAESNVVVMEAFHWRYHPLAARFTELVARGEVGAVTNLDAALSFPLLDRHDIRWSRQLAGGSLLDAGCYPLHQIRTLGAALHAGEPRVVAARASVTRGGVDRTFTGELVFENGITATLRSGFTRPRWPIDTHLRADGTLGRVLAFNPVLPHLGGHLRITTNRRRRQEWFTSTTSYTYQLRAFVDAIRDGTPIPTGPDDSVATMLLIDALLRAAGQEPALPRSPSQEHP